MDEYLTQELAKFYENSIRSLYDSVGIEPLVLSVSSIRTTLEEEKRKLDERRRMEAMQDMYGYPLAVDWGNGSPPKRCECGAHKCHSKIHSSWCPMKEVEG